MKINIDAYKAYLLAIAKELLQLHSPSGYNDRIEPFLQRFAAENGLDCAFMQKGGAIFTIKGKDSRKTLGVCAHADTLGAMVRSIAPDGGLCFTAVGGPLLPTLDGEYCTVITREGKEYTGTFLSKSPAVHVYADSASRPRTEEEMYVRLDEEVRSKEDVERLGICSGDYICLDTKTVVTDTDFIKSRFLDDKISVACLLTILHAIQKQKIVPPHTIQFIVTMYEEVGHGAAFVPEGITRMLAVDMGCIGKDLNCSEYDVSICAKDRGGPYDYAFTSELIALAKQHALQYAVDIYPYYGSDIGAMWRAGHDIPGALIGSGVHASHGMERTHYKGLKNTIALILLYLGITPDL